MKTKKKESAKMVELNLFVEQRCAVLLSQKREGTESLFRCMHKQFLVYMEKDLVSMDMLTPDAVRGFENYLRRSNLSGNSVNTYLSCFRSLYNQAVSEGLLQSIANPFTRLRIRPDQTIKRSLPLNMLEELAGLDLGIAILQLARDLFVFSVLACGIPFVDLAYLTTDNIEGNVLVYHRRKTNARVSIEITKGMLRLIRKYAGKGVGKYLFPILKTENAPYKEYRSALRTYNRRLQKVAGFMKEPVKLTSYTARHSWAMEAKRRNVPISIISEALGHSTQRTTDYYLAQLGHSALAKANRTVVGRLDKLVTGQKKACPLFMK